MTDEKDTFIIYIIQATSNAPGISADLRYYF